MHTQTKLYVGTGAGNNGYVSPDSNHKNDSTKAIGYTIQEVDATPADDFVEVFRGNGVSNNGEVSPDWNFKNDGTESIGFLSKKPILNGTKLYVGKGPNQNGIITNSPGFQGQSAIFIGWAIPG